MEDEKSWIPTVDNRDHSIKENDELNSIARRYGFESIFRRSISSDITFKSKDANGVLRNKSFHSDFRRRSHVSHQTFCYLCSINQHEHETTKPRDESKRRKLLPYKNPKARLSSSTFNRSVRNSSSSDLTPYRFIVRTGTQKDCGTRAQVFLYIYGTEQNWTSVHLQGRQKSNASGLIDGFPSGSTKTFCFRGPDIGQLHHLNVNLVGSRSDREWFLKEIEMTNLNTSTTWLCEFNCWLPKADEREVVDQIKPTIHQPKQSSLSMYILQVRTGEKPYAGTDASIHLTIRGSKNATRRLALTSTRTRLFQQNQLDTFAIANGDLGDLLEIIVESDRSQVATDWNVKEMILWKIIPHDHREKFQVYFPFNNGLGKKLSSLGSKGEVYPSSDQHFKGPICYQISVKTGKATNAGTDANVFVIFYGSRGRTITHQLNNRSKNDFERGSTSEFTIMDIDIGKIDRIKIWHDNSGTNPTWFLDSVVIRKKYSTCSTVSTIYTQRLEQISQVLYRQIHEPMKKESTVLSESGQNIKTNGYNDYGSKDRLNSSRGILRSPTMYDKISLQKKVTWDEQSIGSQDDLLSVTSHRSLPTRALSDVKHNREDSLSDKTGHIDHQAYWISSHNYVDHQWKIASIEEMNSFYLDSTTRSLLLSDRSTMNASSKTSLHHNEDEIYECSANRWLGKDKEEGKLEVHLPAKLIHQSTITSEKQNVLTSKTHTDNQYQKYDPEKGNSKPRNSSVASELAPLERPLKSSTPSLTRQLKSPHNLNDRTTSNSTEQDLLARITGEPSNQSRISSNERLKSPRNINDLTTPSITERQSLTKGSSALLAHSRSSTIALPSSDQSTKSYRSNKELTTPSLLSRETSSKLAYPSQPLSNSSLRSSRPTTDPINTLSDKQELLARITDELPSHASSLTPLHQRVKPMRNINDVTNDRQILAKMSSESFKNPRLTPTSSLAAKQLSQTIPSTKGSIESLSNPTRSTPKLPSQKSIYDQVYNSAYSTVPSDDF